MSLTAGPVKPCQEATQRGLFSKYLKCECEEDGARPYVSVIL